MLNEKFEEIHKTLRDTNDLLRKLEKTSKFLTQHVQTSIALYNIKKK